MIDRHFTYRLVDLDGGSFLQLIQGDPAPLATEAGRLNRTTGRVRYAVHRIRYRPLLRTLARIARAGRGIS